MAKCFQPIFEFWQLAFSLDFKVMTSPISLGRYYKIRKFASPNSLSENTCLICLCSQIKLGEWQSRKEQNESPSLPQIDPFRSCGHKIILKLKYLITPAKTVGIVQIAVAYRFEFTSLTDYCRKKTSFFSSTFLTTNYL